MSKTNISYVIRKRKPGTDEWEIWDGSWVGEDDARRELDCMRASPLFAGYQVHLVKRTEVITTTDEVIDSGPV